VTSARPPGWYDEPSGDRAALRWWDGRAWTAVTRTRMASEPPSEPSSEPSSEPPPEPGSFVDGGRTAAAGDAVDLLDSDAGRARPGGSRRRLATAGIAVAVLALLLAVLPRQNPDSENRLADPGPTPTAPGEVTQPTAEPTRGPTSEPTTPAPTTPRPVTGRVTDRVARLSYDVLPGDWREWDRDTFRGLVSTVGYYRITQDHAPNGETYWANVSSGQVDPDVAPGDVRPAATGLVGVLSRDYYPTHQRRGLTQRALTVDGAPAYLIRYTAIFDPRSAAGYSAKSESVTVLLVDTGDPEPSALYISLPDTVGALWPSVEDLLASVRVIR
jgi:hypothetical protein